MVISDCFWSNSVNFEVNEPFNNKPRESLPVPNEPVDNVVFASATQCQLANDAQCNCWLALLDDGDSDSLVQSVFVCRMQWDGSHWSLSAARVSFEAAYVAALALNCAQTKVVLLIDSSNKHKSGQVITFDYGELGKSINIYISLLLLLLSLFVKKRVRYSFIYLKLEINFSIFQKNN